MRPPCADSFEYSDLFRFRYFRKRQESRKLGILAHFHNPYQKLEVIPHRKKIGGPKSNEDSLAMPSRENLAHGKF